MRLNEVIYESGRPIDGYGDGFWRVAGEKMEGHVCVAPLHAQIWEGYSDAEMLVSLASDIDLLLIGTGPQIAHLPKDLAEQLDAAQIAWEAMASPAAARTYNVLLGEGRRVAVALLTV